MHTFVTFFVWYALCVKICICKILIFEYFPKIPSEMSSTHHFPPILIPNTSIVFFCLFVGGPMGSQNSKKRFVISKKFYYSQKILCTGCPKIVVKIFIFWIFSKIPLKINSTHPFLIPNTLYVKKSFCSYFLF